MSDLLRALEAARRKEQERKAAVEKKPADRDSSFVAALTSGGFRKRYRL